MPTQAPPALVLDELQRRLKTGGLVARRVSFFADDGLMVARRGESTRQVDVLEKAIFLYFESRWTLRVTQHGGPHWVRRLDAALVDQLEEAVLSGLAAFKLPPPPGWVEA